LGKTVIRGIRPPHQAFFFIRLLLVNILFAQELEGGPAEGYPAPEKARSEGVADVSRRIAIGTGIGLRYLHPEQTRRAPSAPIRIDA
jgi:hypothetical protein